MPETPGSRKVSSLKDQSTGYPVGGLCKFDKNFVKFSRFVYFSARAARLRCFRILSFKDLHEMAGSATPEKLANYKLALQLYKTFTCKCVDEYQLQHYQHLKTDHVSS